VAYSLRCADSGMDCPGLFQTKTEDELMKHVELHVGEAHPDMEMTPENAAMVKGLVRTTCSHHPVTAEPMARPCVRPSFGS
jgi:predicted small metal-binding protein